MTERELIERAKEMTKRSYAPYSHYHVGCALLGSDGNVYTGCNIESASYGATLCAERAAIANGVSSGCRSFRLAAVISDHPAVCTPCGICRQLLYEFSDHLIVLCCAPDGQVERYAIEELLPHGFGAASMEESCADDKAVLQYD